MCSTKYSCQGPEARNPRLPPRAAESRRLQQQRLHIHRCDEAHKPSSPPTPAYDYRRDLPLQSLFSQLQLQSRIRRMLDMRRPRSLTASQSRRRTRKLQLRPSRTHANGRRPREGFFFSPRLISGTTQRPDDARSLLLAAGWLCDSLRRPAHARSRTLLPRPLPSRERSRERHRDPEGRRVSVPVVREKVETGRRTERVACGSRPGG